jgi:hypothetical protein
MTGKPEVKNQLGVFAIEGKREGEKITEGGSNLLPDPCPLILR